MWLQRVRPQILAVTLFTAALAGGLIAVGEPIAGGVLAGNLPGLGAKIIDKDD